jgi:arsenite methyltransferase
MSQHTPPPTDRPACPEPPIRELVREHYAAAARHSAAGHYARTLQDEQQFTPPGAEAGCCGTGGCSPTETVYGGDHPQAVAALVRARLPAYLGAWTRR